MTRDESATPSGPPSNKDSILAEEREHVRKLRPTESPPKEKEDPLTGLCLSGGGIRSATFSLGVLQGLSGWPRRDDPELAEEKKAKALEAADYLSTVSGGGYVGSWLTRWIHGESLKRVVETLSDDRPEATQIRYLRAFSNYLAPKMGVSTDRLTLVSIIGRNLILNWLVLVPALTVLLLLPRLAVSLLLLAENWGKSGVVWCGWLAFLLTAVIVGIVAENIPPTPDRPLKSPAPFTILMPVAAFLWTLAWAAYAATDGAWSALHWGVRYGSGAAIGALCHVVGATVILRTLPAIRRAVRPLLDLPRRLSRRPLAPPPPPPSVQSQSKITIWSAAAVIISGAFAGVLLVFGTSLFGAPNTHLEVFVILAMPYLFACYWLSTTLYSALVASWVAGKDRSEAGEAGEPAREWWGRAGGASLKPLLIWVLLTSLVILGPELLLQLGSWASTVVTVGGVGGLVSIFAGLWGRAGVKERPQGGFSAWVQDRLLPIAAGVLLLLLGIFGSLATSYVVASHEMKEKVWSSAATTRVESSAAKAIRERHCADVDLTKKFIDSLDCTTPTNMSVATPTFPLATSSPPASPTPTATATAAIEALARDANQTIAQLKAATNPLGPINLSALVDLHRGVIDAHLRPVNGTAWSELILLGTLLLLLVAAWLLVDVNRFSLHAMYGNRLIRAYLGASRPNRNPNRFSNIDPSDDVAMATLDHRPFHIVNLALNVSNAATQQQFAEQSRRSTSFTISPTKVGSPMTGYADTKGYAGTDGPTLGRAMTISGAAVSPAMGYHSSPIVAAAMTLFNARLGWWLPNPAAPSDVRARSESRWGLWLLFLEFLGFTSDQLEWVHVSDGGHFENLGLYEMVRRGCRRIVVVDATCDPDYRYDDLARSLRMIRADFGVRIEFDGATSPRVGRKPSHHYALARIKYQDERPNESGVLIYIKPVLTGREPMDVAHYQELRRKSGESFPHESTADQFFNEAQFESYRVLGLHSVKELRGRFTSFDDIGPNDVDPTNGGDAPAGASPHEAPGVAGVVAAGAPSVKKSAGWSETFAGLAATLAPAAVTAAVATTVVVGVSGSIGLKPPEKPLEVANPIVHMDVNADLSPLKFDDESLAEFRRALRNPVLRMKRAEIRRLELGVARGVARGDAKMTGKLLALYRDLLTLLTKTEPRKDGGAPPDTAELASLLRAINTKIGTLADEVKKLGPRIDRIGPGRNVTGVR